MKYLLLIVSLTLGFPALGHSNKSKSHKAPKVFFHKKIHKPVKYKKPISKKYKNHYKGFYCGKHKTKPKSPIFSPVVPDFDAEFYYIDNQHQMIYKAMVDGTDVVLKKFRASPYANAYLAQLDYETLMAVEASGSKRITAIDINSKNLITIGNFPFSGSITQAYASGDYVMVNQEGTNNIYYKNVDDGEFSLLGKIKLNGKDMKVNGGDLYISISGGLYMATNGALYLLENDENNVEILNATAVASNLGAITGLVEISNGVMVISTMNSTTMKLVNAFEGTVETLNIKGELKKTGSKGGDLAGFDTL